MHFENRYISVQQFVVSPHGMRGKLDEYCSGDLVKQVCLRVLMATNWDIRVIWSAGMVLNPSATDYGTMEVNMSITGAANEQIVSHWGWDYHDRGMGMGIQALLSEFGNFGDFFENVVLPFGEPPGTAESQPLMFPMSDGGGMCSSPTNSVMDVSDQMLLSAGFPTFNSFNNPQAPTSVEDAASTISNVDGPLSVTDWCRGRSPSNESAMACDGLSSESIASASEGRDSF